MNAKKMYPVNRTKSLFDSILDLTGFQSNTTDIKPPTDSNYNKNTKHDEFEEEDDEEIPDFYHLPKIEVEELHKLFIDHRHKYQALHTLYITAHQEIIRDECMNATAPPSIHYNNDNLRDRSETIQLLLERENTNAKNIFTRIDMIVNDWKQQKQMEKLEYLRSVPPQYSPPPTPFIHINPFEDTFKDKIHHFSDSKKKKKRRKRSDDYFSDDEDTNHYQMKPRTNRSYSYSDGSNPSPEWTIDGHMSMSTSVALSKLSDDNEEEDDEYDHENIFQINVKTKHSRFYSTGNIFSILRKNQSSKISPNKQNSLVKILKRMSSSLNNTPIPNDRSCKQTKSYDDHLPPHHTFIEFERANPYSALSNTSNAPSVIVHKKHKRISYSTDDLSINYKSNEMNRKLIDILNVHKIRSANNLRINKVHGINRSKSHPRKKQKQYEIEMEIIDTDVFQINRQRSVSDSEVLWIENKSLIKKISMDDSCISYGMKDNMTNESIDMIIDECIAYESELEPEPESLIVSPSKNVCLVDDSLQPSLAMPGGRSKSDFTKVGQKMKQKMMKGQMPNNSKKKMSKKQIGFRQNKDDGSSELFVDVKVNHKIKIRKNLQESDTSFDVEITEPPEYQLEEMEKKAQHTSHHRMKHMIPRSDININEHLIPAADIQRRRESVILDVDGDEYQDIQKEREIRMELENKRGMNDEQKGKEDIFGEYEIDQLFDSSDEEKDEQHHSSVEQDKYEHESEKVDEHPLGMHPSLNYSILSNDDLTNDEIISCILDPMDDSSLPSESLLTSLTNTEIPQITVDISANDNKALWTQIMKDVNRTFQYRDFFRLKSTKIALGNLLYIWSRMHPELGYLQGMHDLASIITCVISFDYEIYSEEKKENEKLQKDKIIDLDIFLNKKYLEHDIYAIFSALLELTKKFFEPAVPPQRYERTYSSDDEIIQNNTENDKIEQYWNQGLFDSGLNCSLYLKLHYIQHKLLKNFDLVLYTHFESIGLEPQLYMLRYIRVLFTREFYLHQVIQLWDELFVSSNLLQFIDYIAMAMIYNVRIELLKKSDMTLISILQHYPRDNVDISQLANVARQIQRGLIKLEFDKELYIASEELDEGRILEYFKEAQSLLISICTDSYPCTLEMDDVSNDDTFINSMCTVVDDNTPDIRIPGFNTNILTSELKFNIKRIIHLYYKNGGMPADGPFRMGYLVKRGAGSDVRRSGSGGSIIAKKRNRNGSNLMSGILSRKNLKCRWFVIDHNERLSYYKNKKVFDRKERALKYGIALKGRAIRVLSYEYFCFEISGKKKNTRAYLLFARDFSDFVLWLHAMMWCADKSLYECV